MALRKLELRSSGSFISLNDASSTVSKAPKTTRSVVDVGSTFQSNYVGRSTVSDLVVRDLSAFAGCLQMALIFVALNV